MGPDACPGARRQRRHVSCHVAAIGLEHQAVPGRGLVTVQVQARIDLEMRRADQLARGVVGPAMQRAHNVCCRAGCPASRGPAASSTGGAGRRWRSARCRRCCGPAPGLRPRAAVRSSRPVAARPAHGPGSVGRWRTAFAVRAGKGPRRNSWKSGAGWWPAKDGG